jgi:hypothetical protein
MGKNRRLEDAYRFPGFVPHTTVKGKFSNSTAVVLSLRRRSKKRRHVDVAGQFTRVFMIGRNASSGIIPAAVGGYSLRWKSGGLIAGSAGR